MGIESPLLAIQDNTELIRKGEKLTSEIVQNYLAEVLPHVSEDVIMYVLYKRIHVIYFSTRIIQKLIYLLVHCTIIFFLRKSWLQQLFILEQKILS